MTAREMFKDNKPKGKILKCSKGGYDYGRNVFAYCICDDGQKYNIRVLSEVHPKEYSVNYSEETNVTTLENAILYNEYRARVIANRSLEH
jgi:hypothetical protein